MLRFRGLLSTASSFLLRILVVAGVPPLAASSAADPEVAQRVEALLARMTLEEKVHQMASDADAIGDAGAERVERHLHAMQGIPVVELGAHQHPLKARQGQEQQGDQEQGIWQTQYFHGPGLS